MAQDGTDRRHWHPGRDHLASEAGAQPVGAEGRQPGARAGTPHDRGNAETAEPFERGCGSQEHLPARAAGPSPGQVTGNRLADVGWQGEAVEAAALAVHNDFAGAPVDVTEAERRHLAGSEP